MTDTKASLLARARSTSAQMRGREAAILLTLLNHPSLIETCGEEVAAAEFSHADLESLRRALMSDAAEHAASTRPVLCERLDAAFGLDVFRLLATTAPAAAASFAAQETAPAMAETVLRESLSRQHADTARAREIVEAEAALTGDGTGVLTARLRSATDAAHREAAGADAGDDGGEAELSMALRSMIDREIWKKKPRGRGDANH